MNMKLWIDDERPTPEGYTHTAKTSQEAIDLLDDAMDCGIIVEHVSFDHDLGYNYEDGHSMLVGGVQDDTSRRVMTWMIENNFWPNTLSIHTQNPVGFEWLRGTAIRYAPEWVEFQ